MNISLYVKFRLLDFFVVQELRSFFHSFSSLLLWNVEHFPFKRKKTGWMSLKVLSLWFNFSFDLFRNGTTSQLSPSLWLLLRSFTQSRISSNYISFTLDFRFLYQFRNLFRKKFSKQRDRVSWIEWRKVKAKNKELRLQVLNWTLLLSKKVKGGKRKKTNLLRFAPHPWGIWAKEESREQKVG